MNPNNNPNQMQHLQQPMMGNNFAQPPARNPNLQKKISEVDTHICGEVCLLLFFGVLLAAQYNNECIAATRRLIVVFLIYLVIYKIPINLLKTFTLRRYQKESIAGLGCGVISKAFLTGWMIYSYVVYFGLEDGV